MRIGIPAETRPGETRVAATPETVTKLAAKHQVIVQSGAGGAMRARGVRLLRRVGVLTIHRRFHRTANRTGA